MSEEKRLPFHEFVKEQFLTCIDKYGNYDGDLDYAVECIEVEIERIIDGMKKKNENLIEDYFQGYQKALDDVKKSLVREWENNYE